MKKITLATLFFLLVSMLFANGNAEQSAVESGVTEITFWSSDSEASLRSVLQDTVNTYNASQSFVKVVPEFMDDENLKMKLRVAAAGGEMPNIFNYWTGEIFEQMIDAGVIAEIGSSLKDDQTFMSNITEGALENMEYNGGVYGMPLGSTNVFFWYNEDIFNELNLNVPKTFDELLNAIEVINQSGKKPIALGGKEVWPLLFYFSYLSNRIGGSEPFEKAVEGNGDFMDPSFIKASQMIQTLADRGAFGPGFLGVASAQADAEFLSGNSAMVLMGDWMAGYYTSTAQFNIGQFPFPSVKDGLGDSGMINGGISGVMAIGEDSSKKVDATKDFLKFMMSPEERAKYVAVSGAPSIIKVDLSSFDINPELANYIATYSENGTGYFPFYDQAIDSKRADKILQAISIIAIGNDIEPELSKIK